MSHASTEHNFRPFLGPDNHFLSPTLLSSAGHTFSHSLSLNVQVHICKLLIASVCMHRFFLLCLTLHCTALYTVVMCTGLWNWLWELCCEAGSAGECGKCNINFLIFQSAQTAPSAAISITATGLRTSRPSTFYLKSQKSESENKPVKVNSITVSMTATVPGHCPALYTSWPSSSLYLVSPW